MKTVPIGNEDFKRIIENDNYYVDKTKLIEDLLNDKTEVVLFTRPRIFGKSLMISMLDNFFNIEKSESNEHLFDNLYISKSSVYKNNFGKYPVIKLNLKDTKRNNYNDFFDSFKIIISRLYTEKSYVTKVLDNDELNKFNLIKSENASIEDYTMSIKFLSDWLKRYHNSQVIILVDEYDAPFVETYRDSCYDEVMSVIKSLFSSCLKGNNSVKMGVLIGILRVSIFSDFNNLVIKDIMSTSYNEYFGFTEKETQELLEYYGLEYNDDVKNYYDGYNFGGISVYNPWSILNYVSKKVLKPYWVNTSSNLLIKKCLGTLDVREKIQVKNLIQGYSISFEYNEKLTYKDLDCLTPENTYNLLLTSGYLTLDHEEIEIDADNTKKYFRLPNTEVRIEIKSIMQKIIFGRVLFSTSTYEEFLSSFINDDKRFIENFINELLPGTSYHDIKHEYAYELYLSGLLGGFMNKNFIVKSNRESGTGRSDILIERVDKSFGMVIEIKAASSNEEMETLADKALNQIKEHEYYKELELDKVKNIKQYAVVFYEKSAIVR